MDTEIVWLPEKWDGYVKSTSLQSIPRFIGDDSVYLTTDEWWGLFGTSSAYHVCIGRLSAYDEHRLPFSDFSRVTKQWIAEDRGVVITNAFAEMYEHSMGLTQIMTEPEPIDKDIRSRWDNICSQLGGNDYELALNALYCSILIAPVVLLHGAPEPDILPVVREIGAPTFRRMVAEGVPLGAMVNVAKHNIDFELLGALQQGRMTV